MQNILKIFGRHPAEELLSTQNPIKVILLQNSVEPRFAEKIFQLAKEKNVQVKRVPKQQLDQHCPGENHQGILVETVMPDLLSLDQLLDTTTGQPTRAFAILDGIEDPHNLGAIIRVANSAGIQGIILPRRRSAKLTAGTIKASAGAAFHTPIAEVPNISRSMEQLKEAGFWMIGAEMESAQLPWEIDMKMDIGFVLGHEGHGLHRLVREKCDFLACLPMLGQVSSLNVSTAASVLFYERVRQQSLKAPQK